MDPGQSSKNNKEDHNPSSSQSLPLPVPESSIPSSLNITFDPSNELVWTPHTEPASLSWLNNFCDDNFSTLFPPFQNEMFGDFDQRNEQEVPHHHNINNQVPDEGASSKDKGLDQSDQNKRTEQPRILIDLNSVPSSSSNDPANASNKNINDDDESKLKNPAAAPLQDIVEEENEEEEEEQMVPPLHIHELAFSLQNMYRYHGVEEDELDGVLLENPFGYEKLREDHMPYLKRFETLQQEREAAAAAHAATFGRRPYHYTGAQTHYPYQARERDPDYLPSSSRDSKRTVRITRTIDSVDPSQPPILSFRRNRKKPGCACSKSRCVKNLCGCIVLETGCNAKCRCTDCENPFGRKPGKVPKGRPPKLIIKRGISLK